MILDTQRRTWAYACALAIAAVATGLVVSEAGYGLGDPWTIVALITVNAVAERSGVWITRTLQLSIALLPTLFAAVLFGPLAAGLVNAASMLGDSELFSRPDPERAPRLKWATYTSTRFLTGVAAGFIALGIKGSPASGLGRLLAATLVAALVAEILDILSAGITARIRGRDIRDVLRPLAPLLLTSVPLYAPIVAILALAYSEVSPWTAPLFFIPALAAQRLFGMYQQQRQFAQDLKRANMSFAEALVATLEKSDRYTAGHSKAVAIYSRDITKRLGLSPDVQERAYLCGLVHDIGKIGLPASLLLKDGPLTLEERRQMQEHPAIGETILEKVDLYADVAVVVRHHHERIDGEGYPDGLSGSEIPLLSRVIAVADAYNAMTSHRPYREAMSSRVARLRLAQAVESQFDTSVVAAFEAILASAGEDYRMAKREDFDPSGYSAIERLLSEEDVEPRGDPEVAVGVA
ncbi:HD domain-containing protein [Gaiella occulta]|uniref:HD domain-containing protein n=1 Tax=Gaiella occulta TaxID=1002870 RepID=A0A7M2YWT1_9ACTN|nr:HD domain-containing phosphohydrolase [Gaiella occulta]RDI74344.1 HD domain-containing protein [Gaiella occulta]